MGSSIGHAIGGFFGGGSAPAEAEQANTAAATNAYGDAQTSSNEWGARNCEVDAKQFTKCLDENGGNMQICGWYLDQLVSFVLVCGSWFGVDMEESADAWAVAESLSGGC